MQVPQQRGFSFLSIWYVSYVVNVTSGSAGNAVIFAAALAFANPAAFAATAFSVALVKGWTALVVDFTGDGAEDTVGIFADKP